MTEAIEADNLLSDAVMHGFFTRSGGVSKGIYEGLNCGIGSDDDPALVDENRRLVAQHLSARRDTPIASLYQIHSDVVEVIKGSGFDPKERPRGDAMVTKSRGVILGILTADCAPVLFADKSKAIIGAAHAGWKGVTFGILENTIDAMLALGSDKQDICAAVGPCIAQSSYEVGLDFQESLLTGDSDSAYFIHPGIDGMHFQFDLGGYIIHRLKRKGLENIYHSMTDTYHGESRFFSYRRSTHQNQPDYGRQISAIMLK